MRPFLYDLMYRWGAPWEIGPRSELVELVESGRLTPERLAPGRAIDLGCGSGANSIFLAQRGFEVVGVDFSAVALRKAEGRSAAAGVSDRVAFVRGDLTADTIEGAGGPFDLLVDYGTLDDLGNGGRRRMADTVIRLARPGAAFLLWAFYAARADLPRISFGGPSKVAPGLEPGEERELFGSAFRIERLPRPEPGSRFACFLMERLA
jgi:SAM-dependent methyltransferase